MSRRATTRHRAAAIKDGARRADTLSLRAVLRTVSPGPIVSSMRDRWLGAMSRTQTQRCRSSHGILELPPSSAERGLIRIITKRHSTFSPASNRQYCEQYVVAGTHSGPSSHSAWHSLRFRWSGKQDRHSPRRGDWLMVFLLRSSDKVHPCCPSRVVEMQHGSNATILSVLFQLTEPEPKSKHSRSTDTAK